MKNTFLYFLLFITLFSFSQNTQNESITSVYKKNSENKPETIYTHLSKSNVVLGETLWFQTYIYSNKNSELYRSSSNIYYNVYNEFGVLVDQKVFLGKDGVSNGQIEIDKDYEPGIYYLKTTTNWMRNFNLDLSDVKTFVVNSETKINKTTVTSLQIKPEGGNLIYDTFNNLVINFHSDLKLTNSNLKGVLFDNNDKTLQVINLNIDGYGKFNFKPEIDKDYIIKIINKNNEVIFSKPIIDIKEKGINIKITDKKDSYNIKLETNISSIKALKEKTYKLLIHRDGNIKNIPIEFNEKSLQYNASLLKSEIFSGINIITILNENNDRVLERIIFNTHGLKIGNVQSVTTNKKRDSTTITISSNSKVPKNFSVSILPKDTKGNNFEDTILSKILFDPYISSNTNKYNKYITKITRESLYNLDLLLISEHNSRQSITSIINTPPIIRYPFDTGFQVKGKLNKTEYKPENILELISPLNAVQIKTTPDEENYFQFTNLYLSKNSKINFVLRNKNKKLIKVFPYYNLYPIPYIDTLDVSRLKQNIQKPEILQNINTDNFIISADVVALDTVNIENVKQEKKVVNNYFNSRQQDRVNIEKAYPSQLVIDFIRAEGFDVAEANGSFTIFSNRNMGFTKFPTQVFLDNAPITNSLEFLAGVRMSEIEEMFISKSGAGLGAGAAGGFISIYRKKGINNNINRGYHKTFTVASGFDIEKEFETPFYNSLQSEKFDHYGIINWKPQLKSDNKGDISYKIKNSTYTKKVKIIINGIDDDGYLYYYTTILDI